MSGIFKEPGGKSKWTLALVLALSLASVLKAQPAAKTHVATPVYDVVSIVPNKADSNNSSFWTHDGSFTATNVSFKSLLSGAYGIRDGLISGVPDWANAARFDINAKIVDPDVEALKKLTKEQRSAMMAQILTERFQVKVHTEVKTLAVYALVVGKNGAKVKESPPAAKVAATDEAKKDITRGGWRSSDTELTANAVHLAALTDFLSGRLNRTVIDKTGFVGEYDLHLTWAREEAEIGGVEAGQKNTSESTAPSIFTALQEQLGLKLESTKGPVTTLVVDHAEPPSSN